MSLKGIQVKSNTSWLMIFCPPIFFLGPIILLGLVKQPTKLVYKPKKLINFVELAKQKSQKA